MFLVGAAALAVGVVVNVGFRRARHRPRARWPPPARPPRPRRGRVNFSSDPDGATVSRRTAGAGNDALSTQIAYSDAPVEVVIQKAGFQPKTVAFVPNMPIPVVAVLRKESARRRSDAPRRRRPPMRRRRAHVATHAPPVRPRGRPHSRGPTSVSDVDQDDDVMAPTTW